MSIRNAIALASKEVLADYLAPELVDRLTDDILQRTASELASAVDEFTGFDFTPKGPARARGMASAPQHKATPGRRGRRSSSAAEVGNLGALDQGEQQDGDKDYHQDPHVRKVASGEPPTADQMI